MGPRGSRSTCFALAPGWWQIYRKAILPCATVKKWHQANACKSSEWSDTLHLKSQSTSSPSILYSKCLPLVVAYSQGLDTHGQLHPPCCTSLWADMKVLALRDSVAGCAWLCCKAEIPYHSHKKKNMIVSPQRKTIRARALIPHYWFWGLKIWDRGLKVSTIWLGNADTCAVGKATFWRKMRQLISLGLLELFTSLLHFVAMYSWLMLQCQ